MVSVSPVELLSSVLGRVARTVAATAHFSLDRFSDVYLITDALAAYADRAAAGERITARLTASERQLSLIARPVSPRQRRSCSMRVRRRRCRCSPTR